MIEDKTILITGGFGFIGTALAQRVVKGNRLIIYDNERRNSMKYTTLGENPNVVAIRGDILDKRKLAECFDAYKPDIVVHLAAMAGVSDYFRYPLQTMEVNILGTHNVLEVAKEHNIKMFVNFSTSEVYGPYIFRAKEDEPTSQGEVKVQRWTYSVSKLAAEHFCFAYKKKYDLPIVSIRPFNIYGPGQVGEGAVQIFVPLALRDEAIQVTNDGNQIRAWCYIDDMIDGILLCLENDQVNGEVFNIGNPSGTVTILGLAEKIIRLTRSNSTIKFIPHPSTDVELRVPNIKKAEKQLGFKPKVGLDEGLLRSIEWYRRHDFTNHQE